MVPGYLNAFIMPTSSHVHHSDSGLRTRALTRSCLQQAWGRDTGWGVTVAGIEKTGRAERWLEIILTTSTIAIGELSSARPSRRRGQNPSEFEDLNYSSYCRRGLVGFILAPVQTSVVRRTHESPRSPYSIVFGGLGKNQTDAEPETSRGRRVDEILISKQDVERNKSESESARTESRSIELTDSLAELGLGREKERHGRAKARAEDTRGNDPGT
ncbi:hypothetical protein B0H16DRAFT_1446511 [Mycena metata]|uniref:Uncharacterized protein n=1 Tax=Mycena metata TaxID=1033252 RepID=A0AAD7KEW9_9AGAR|nr:hypothetical protein B0H16DRAFT_1446511 [Mycena metata]